jgi:hypothetical protein
VGAAKRHALEALAERFAHKPAETMGVLQRANMGRVRISSMFGRGPSLIAIAWIVIGVIVAASQDYFDSLETAGRVLTAIAAVLLWPLLLFGFDIRISR